VREHQTPGISPAKWPIVGLSSAKRIHARPGSIPGAPINAAIASGTLHEMEGQTCDLCARCDSVLSPVLSLTGGVGTGSGERN
jgi:hypothetical protein